MSLKTLLVAAVAAVCVGSSFGYAVTDKDPNGNPYSGGGYVLSTKSDGDFNQAFYKGADNWSDGKDVHADADYYVNKHTLKINASAAFKESHSQTFPGKSLIIGDWASLMPYGSDSWDAYKFTINDLRLRGTSALLSWWDMSPAKLCGKLTIVKDGGVGSDDTANRTYGPRIVPGKGSAGFYIDMKLVGAAGIYTRVQRYCEALPGATNPTTGADRYSIDDDKDKRTFVEFQGDNSEFFGTVLVGDNIAVRFLNDLANGAVEVDGINRNNSTLYGTDASNTALGVCDGKVNGAVKLGKLKLADGVILECGNMLKNLTGFEVLGDYVQEGKVKLDFANAIAVRKSFTLLTVKKDQTLEAGKFEVVNQPNAGYTLSVVEAGETKSLVLANPDATDYVTITGPEKEGSNFQDYLYFGTATWADGKRPNASSDYLIRAGEQIRFPVSWAIMDAAGFSGGNNRFAGKSLRIMDGGVAVCGGTGYSSDTYDFVLDSLVLDGGALVKGDNGSPAKFSSKTTITVKGTAAKPTLIENGHNNWNATGNNSGFALRNKFVGAADSYLQVYNNKNQTLPSFISEVVGNNDGYLGTVEFKNMMCPVKFGPWGFRNAAVKFTAEAGTRPAMGVTNSNANADKLIGALIPFRKLSVPAGMKILANELVKFNGGYGYKVTEAFEQGGKVTIDFAGEAIPATMKNVYILQAPALDAANFEVVNQPTAGYQLEVIDFSGAKMLVLTNPSIPSIVSLKASDPWASWGESSFVTNVLTAGRGWSDGLAPHAGADYLVSNSCELYTPQDAAAEITFAGDSLTLDCGKITHPNWSDKAPFGKTSTTVVNDMIVKAGFMRLGCASDTTWKGKLTIDSTGVKDKAKNPIWYYTWTGRHENHMKIVGGADERVFCTSGATAKNGSPSYPNAGDGATKNGDTYSWSKYIGSMYYRFYGDCSEFFGTFEGDWATCFTLDSAYKFGGTFELNHLSHLELGTSEKNVSLNRVLSRDSQITVKSNAKAVADEIDSAFGDIASHVYDGIDVYTGKAVETPYNYVYRAPLNNGRGVNLLRVESGATLKVGTLKLDNTSVELYGTGVQLEVENLILGKGGYTLSGTTGQIKVNGKVITDGNDVTVSMPAGKRLSQLFVLGEGAQVDYSKIKIAGSDLKPDQYRLVEKTVDGVKKLFAEDLGAFANDNDVKGIYVYQTASDYRGYYMPDGTSGNHNGTMPEGGTAISSMIDPYFWSDKLAPHAGAEYYVGLWHSVYVVKAGTYEFGGDSLTFATSKNAGGTYNEQLLRSDPASDLTFKDVRFCNGVGFFSAGGAGTVQTIRGKVRILSETDEAPFYIRYSNRARFVCYADLIGGPTRGFTTQINSNAGDVNKKVTIELLGNNDEYYGTALMKANGYLCLGESGLKHGTADISTAFSGIASYAATPVEVKALKLAAGATIVCDQSAAGLVVSELTLPVEGKVKLDFGAKPLARRVTVLSVPESVELGVEDFEIVTPNEKFELAVEVKDGVKSLVYTRKAGLMLIFK